MNKANIFALRTILTHRLKKARRSLQFAQRFIHKLLAAFLGLFLLFELFLVGLFLDTILLHTFPSNNPVMLVHGFVFHFFLILLAFRLFVEKPPVVHLQPYLPLPLPKSRLMRSYLMIFSLRFFNLIPLFIALPFLIKVVLPAHGVVSCLLWLSAILMLTMMVNLAALYIKLSTYNAPLNQVLISSMILLFVLLNELNPLSFLQFSSLWLFEEILDANIVPVAMLAVICVASYFIAMSSMRKCLYVDFSSSHQPSKPTKNQNVLLGAKHKFLYLLKLELALIFRNKRVRFIQVNIFTMSFFGLAYLFFSLEKELMFGVFIGLMLAMSAVALSYTIHAFRFRSPYCDALYTRPLLSKNIGGAILGVSHLGTLLCFILLFIFAAILASDAVGLVLAMGLYAMGFVNGAYAYMSTFDTARFEPNASLFSTKGVIVSNPLLNMATMAVTWLISALLVILSPSLFHAQFYVPLGAIGLIGLGLQSKWIKLINNNLEKRKYLFLEGFRVK